MKSHCGNADGMMVRGSEGWRREGARDGGGEERRTEKIRCCYPVDILRALGSAWNGEERRGVFHKQVSNKLLRRSSIRVHISLVCALALHFSALWFATGDRIVTLASVISCSSNPSRNPIFPICLSPPLASCTIFVSTAKDEA